jgi:hypothetical protein
MQSGGRVIRCEIRDPSNNVVVALIGRSTEEVDPAELFGRVARASGAAFTTVHLLSLRHETQGDGIEVNDRIFDVDLSGRLPDQTVVAIYDAAGQDCVVIRESPAT